LVIDWSQLRRNSPPAPHWVLHHSSLVMLVPTMGHSPFLYCLTHSLCRLCSIVLWHPFLIVLPPTLRPLSRNAPTLLSRALLFYVIRDDRYSSLPFLFLCTIPNHIPLKHDTPPLFPHELNHSLSVFFSLPHSSPHFLQDHFFSFDPLFSILISCFALKRYFNAQPICFPIVSFFQARTPFECRVDKDWCFHFFLGVLCWVTFQYYIPFILPSLMTQSFPVLGIIFVSVLGIVFFDAVCPLTNFGWPSFF